MKSFACFILGILATLSAQNLLSSLFSVLMSNGQSEINPMYNKAGMEIAISRPRYSEEWWSSPWEALSSLATGAFLFGDTEDYNIHLTTIDYADYVALHKYIPDKMKYLKEIHLAKLAKTELSEHAIQNVQVPILPRTGKKMAIETFPISSTTSSRTTSQRSLSREKNRQVQEMQYDQPSLSKIVAAKNPSRDASSSLASRHFTVGNIKDAEIGQKGFDRLVNHLAWHTQTMSPPGLAQRFFFVSSDANSPSTELSTDKSESLKQLWGGEASDIGRTQGIEGDATHQLDLARNDTDQCICSPCDCHRPVIEVDFEEHSHCLLELSDAIRVCDGLKGSNRNVRCRKTSAYLRLGACLGLVSSVDWRGEFPFGQYNPHRLVYTRIGVMLVNAYDTGVSHSLIRYGEYIQSVEEVFRPFSRRGGVCLVAGAHIGALGFLLADRVGAEGKVLLFEPDRDFFRLLTANLAINDISNAEAYNIALGEAEGFSESPITQRVNNLHDHQSTAKSIVRTKTERTNLDSRTHYSVPVKKIDKLGLKSIDTIFVDVMELASKILLGAIQTIRSHHPAIIISVNQATDTSFISMLLGEGYTCNITEIPFVNKLVFNQMIIKGRFEANDASKKLSMVVCRHPQKE